MTDVVIEDLQGKKERIKSCLYCIVLTVVTGIMGIGILYALFFAGFIILGTISFLRNDKIYFSDTSIRCNSPDCKSKYVSLFGTATIPYKDISLVSISKSKGYIKFLISYNIDFIDKHQNKIAIVPLYILTSEEYLKKLKTQFEALKLNFEENSEKIKVSNLQEYNDMHNPQQTAENIGRKLEL